MNTLERHAIRALLKQAQTVTATAIRYDEQTHARIDTAAKANHQLETREYWEGWAACYAQMAGTLAWVAGLDRKDGEPFPTKDMRQYARQYPDENPGPFPAIAADKLPAVPRGFLKTVEVETANAVKDLGEVFTIDGAGAAADIAENLRWLSSMANAVLNGHIPITTVSPRQQRQADRLPTSPVGAVLVRHAGEMIEDGSPSGVVGLPGHPERTDP